MSDLPVNQPYNYAAFGLRIGSDLPLPNLIRAEPGADIRIRLHNFAEGEIESEMSAAERFERAGCIVRMSADKNSCEWKGIGRSLVRHGTEILIEPAKGTDPSALAPFICGALMGSLLCQRGSLVLHGSMVLVDGEGYGILGDKGAGKSTLAAHLRNRGHLLVTDDLIPVDLAGDAVTTRSGYPQIGLWSDSAGSIGLDPDELPRVNSLFDKRSFAVPGGFYEGKVPVKYLFVLEDSGTPEILRLGPRESFIEVVKNTYLNRYLRALNQTAEHFRQCEAIVRSVPVFRVLRPRRFEMLPQVTEMIESAGAAANGTG